MSFRSHTEALTAVLLTALPELRPGIVYDSRGLTLLQFLKQQATTASGAYVKLGAFEADEQTILTDSTVGSYRRTAIIYLVGLGLFGRIDALLKYCNTAKANYYQLEDGSRWRFTIRGGVDLEDDLGFPAIEITLEIFNIAKS